MPSPAERYAAARRRGSWPLLTEFRAGFAFELDDFQVQACEALEDGYGVLVCAPTGAGKTVVGEFAVHLALGAGQKCFYTTPIKALSNQKFADLTDRYGSDRVGLLTGDNSVNSDAPVVVMTTEVLRNMLYVGSPALDGLGYVVMDEVHYLGDRFRGAVWEEAIIHLPASVRLVSLSATVSNAEEFAEWLVTVRGDTEVVVHEERPVPLWQHMIVGPRLYDLFSEASVHTEHPVVDPELQRRIDDQTRSLEPYGRGRGERVRRPPRGWRPPDRAEVVTRLDRDGLLPAITFIFSRAGCDAAVRQCITAGLWLTEPQEREEIAAIVTRATAAITSEDLEVLGYWEWLDGLNRGFAAHHAGLVPAFKEAVEALFVRGLVRAVFATETLALGINMPARTVVLERLTKFNGETHAEITAGEYTQLTGRAGRRGIDIEGHAVVVWAPDVDPRRVAGLASTRTYPLRSSFRPSYNMAVNLVGQLGQAKARELLDSSFAQFQADRSVAGLVAQIRRNTATADAERSRGECHLGDFAAYMQLRRQLSAREAELARIGNRSKTAGVVASLEALRPGDVIRVPRGRHAGLAVVLENTGSDLNDPRPMVVTESRWSGRLAANDFAHPVEALARVRLPRNMNMRQPQTRRDILSSLRNLDLPPAVRQRATEPADGPDSDVADLRAAVRQHPCHQCADRDAHAQLAHRADRLEQQNDGLRQKVDSRTGSLGRAFDRICALLTDLGYLQADRTTPAGERLARIWSDSDLVVAECLRRGVWTGLDEAELAAAVSSLVYEARRDERAPDRMPSAALRDALAATVSTWSELAGSEEDQQLTRSREPELGFVWPAYHWVKRKSLDVVLSSAAGPEMPAGDFVRWCKQVLDLLEQIGSLADAQPEPTTGLAPSARPVRDVARAAARDMRRGVVAQGILT